MNTLEREAVQRLIVATRDLLKAHEALMPGIRYIAVQDYALQNDAPRAAREAIRDVNRRLSI